MPDQVTPSDPTVSFDTVVFERVVATRLKAAGITTSTQLATMVANITTANNPGMSAATCQLLQALAAAITMVP